MTKEEGQPKPVGVPVAAQLLRGVSVLLQEFETTPLKGGGSKNEDCKFVPYFVLSVCMRTCGR